MSDVLENERLALTRFLIFDLETSGIPDRKAGFHHRGANQYYPPDQFDHYGDARVVQIAWYLHTGFYEVDPEEVHSYIAKRSGFSIPNSHIHGITEDMCDKKGIALSKIIKDKGFRDALTQADYLVAHNVWFDVHVLLSELHRMDGFNGTIAAINKIPKLCTSELGRGVCRIDWRGPGNKHPRLEELHQHYTGEGIEGAHDAGVDVLATVTCLECLLMDNEILADITDDGLEMIGGLLKE